MRTRTLAPPGTTGNVTLPAAQGMELDSDPDDVCFAFTVEAVGATPTVTYKFQGSQDGVTWFDIFYVTEASDTAAATTRVVTTIAQSLLWPSNQRRRYRFVRVVTTANTNVTFRAEVMEYD